MTREEMLAKLERITCYAVPIEFDMYMGLEYEYITSKGAGGGLDTFYNWPAHKLRVPGNWNGLLVKAKKKQITADDIAGSDLERLLKIKPYDAEDATEVSIEGLASLSDFIKNHFSSSDCPEYIYCLVPNECDFMFCSTLEELEVAFANVYVNEIKDWKDMDDEELRGWYERTENDITNLYLSTFYDEDEQ